MPALGLDWHDGFTEHDLITGEHGNWTDHAHVRVGRGTEPLHVIHVQRA